MLLRRHNLNLLPILRELLRTRSVGRTAQIVGLSQSAVSAALARLRETYNDDLLVMVGRRLELTERGQQLIEPTERACMEVEVLLRPPQFDPSSETRCFVVATADYVSYLLAPELARRLAVEAPNASVHFIDIPSDLTAQLQRGGVDLVVIPEGTGGGLGEMASAPLFSDRMVVIASSKRAGADRQITLEDYEAARHAQFRPSPKTAISHQESSLRVHGICKHNLILVEQFLTLPAIVQASDCLALVQRRLAERFALNHEIALLNPPFEVAPLIITGYWAPSVARDPAHIWFRTLMVGAGAALGPAVGV